MIQVFRGKSVKKFSGGSKKHQRYNWCIFLERKYITIFLGAYGKDVTQRIDLFIKDNLNVENKRILVIGSITPWLELIMLKQGAANVTMLDYHDYKVNLL